MFRLQILQVEYATPDEVDAIFSNITDIVELTMTLISSLEDTLEMAEEGQVIYNRPILFKPCVRIPFTMRYFKNMAALQ